MLQRTRKLREKIEEQNLGALFIAKPENRRYMTGFTGSAGYVFVTDDEVVLLTDSRYTEQARRECPDVTVIQHGTSFYDTLAAELKQRGVKQIGFEKDFVTYRMFELLTDKLTGIALKPTGGLIESLRVVKDAAEVAIIREAARIADEAFTHILSYLRPGLREMDVALELETFMRKQGATSTSFDTIVASGYRSSLPHGVASDKVLEAGDFVKLDFGAYYKGYCSDLTRTVVLGPGPSDKQREIYEVVLSAQLHALEHLRAGLTGQEADALARDIIKARGYGDLFGHSLGHGIGLVIHENPRLSAVSDDVLVPGMVATVEPGIYVANFGGVRIEDDVLITETGIERLTNSPKELLVL